MSLRMRFAVRSYELDMLGHVNHTVYYQWAEHARTELFRVAGCGMEVWIRERRSPVMLETRVRFLGEVRPGGEVEVLCWAEFGAGKTFSMRHELRHLDGRIAAEVDVLLGVLDLDARRLLPDPQDRLIELGADLAALAAPDGAVPGRPDSGRPDSEPLDSEVLDSQPFAVRKDHRVGTGRPDGAS